uniref:Uncharacterized protein n=1 Tax=Meloidogyne enterolobii TaxID=390850 RepID=A0A6V7UDW0_MELEN|nr:unnamed protein product [Meloidogyne enterolobii]
MRRFEGISGYRAFFITSLQLLYHFIDSRKEEIWPLSLPKVLNFSTPAVKKDEITDIPPNFLVPLESTLNPSNHLISPDYPLYPGWWNGGLRVA